MLWDSFLLLQFSGKEKNSNPPYIKYYFPRSTLLLSSLSPYLTHYVFYLLSLLLIFPIPLFFAFRLTMINAVNELEKKCQFKKCNLLNIIPFCSYICYISFYIVSYFSIHI